MIAVDIRPQASDVVETDVQSGIVLDLNVHEVTRPVVGTVNPADDNVWQTVALVPLNDDSEDDDSDLHITAAASLEALDDWARHNPFDL